MRCPHCKTKFKPKYFLQKYCLLTDECIKAFSVFANSEKNKKKAKRKPIQKLSGKRKQEMFEYLKLRSEFLPGKICPVTNRPATEIHHSYSGKDRGKYFLETNTWIGVTREGHAWIHANPKEARELGLLK